MSSDNSCYEEIVAQVEEGRIHPGNIALKYLSEETRNNMLCYRPRQSRLRWIGQSAYVIAVLVLGLMIYLGPISGVTDGKFISTAIASGVFAIVGTWALVLRSVLWERVCPFGFPAHYEQLSRLFGMSPDEINNLATEPHNTTLENRAEEAMVASCLRVLSARRLCTESVAESHVRLERGDNPDSVLDRLWKLQVERRAAIKSQRNVFKELRDLGLLRRSEGKYFALAMRSVPSNELPTSD